MLPVNGDDLTISTAHLFVYIIIQSASKNSLYIFIEKENQRMAFVSYVTDRMNDLMISYQTY